MLCLFICFLSSWTNFHYFFPFYHYHLMIILLDFIHGFIFLKTGLSNFIGTVKQILTILCYFIQDSIILSFHLNLENNKIYNKVLQLKSFLQNYKNLQTEKNTLIRNPCEFTEGIMTEMSYIGFRYQIAQLGCLLNVTM